MTAQPQTGLNPSFYRVVAQSNPGLLFCHNLEGVLFWLNRNAADSLGYTERELVGAPLENVLSLEFRTLLPFYLAQIRRTGSAHGTARIRSKSGEERLWVFRNIVCDDPELSEYVLGNALDLTERVREHSALRDLFRHIPVGEMELDASGKLRRINPAACKILGYSEYDLFFVKNPSPTEELFREIAAEGESPRLVILKRDDGQVLHLEVHVRQLQTSGSAQVRLLCAFIDVSERIRAEAKIRNLNAQLEARVAARSAELRQAQAEAREFAYMASHDLQAPLRQVSGRLEQLASKSVSPADASVLLRQSQADLQRMSKLVDSLLNFALASNRTDGESPRVALTLTLEESLMNLASAIAESNAVITYEGLPDIEVSESDFSQLFQNLIGNALKYRTKEAPRIRISAAKADRGWIVSIADNGVGIDPAQLEKIFEPFHRLHGKEHAGSGMGLAICKKIVERTRGRIWAESQPGKGSTFHFTILES